CTFIVSFIFVHFLSNHSSTLPSSALPASSPQSAFPFSKRLSSLLPFHSLLNFPNPTLAESFGSSIPTSTIPPLNHAIPSPILPSISFSIPRNRHAFARLTFLKSSQYLTNSPLTPPGTPLFNPATALPAPSAALKHSRANNPTLTRGSSGALIIHSRSFLFWLWISSAGYGSSFCTNNSVASAWLSAARAACTGSETSTAPAGKLCASVDECMRCKR